MLSKELKRVASKIQGRKVNGAHDPLYHMNYDTDYTEIYQALKAIDQGLIESQDLEGELDLLAEILETELDENGEYERGMLSQEKIDEAEGNVVEAWGRVQDEMPGSAIFHYGQWTWER